MRLETDPLYSIFEQHLFNALVEDDCTEAFLVRVVEDYVGRLLASGTVIPAEVMPLIQQDLKDEVLEMLRKKTYGHFNLHEFRRAKGVAVEAAPLTQEQQPHKAKTRRHRRAC